MIERIWDPLLAQSLGPGRDEARRAALSEIEFWCAKHKNGPDVWPSTTRSDDDPASENRSGRGRAPLT